VIVLLLPLVVIVGPVVKVKLPVKVPDGLIIAIVVWSSLRGLGLVTVASIVIPVILFGTRWLIIVPFSLKVTELITGFVSTVIVS